MAKAGITSPKTLQSLIDDIFIREGDRYAEPPKIDQPTGRGGITLQAYQRFCDAMQPGRRVTKLDLAGLSHEDARAIVQWFLFELNREMGLDAVKFEHLRLHLLDWGYNSGGPLALRWLQRVLQVPRTGAMDVATVLKLGQSDLWLVHHALAFARLLMIDMATDPGGSVDAKFEEGLENRALSFSLLQIP